MKDLKNFGIEYWIITSSQTDDEVQDGVKHKEFSTLKWLENGGVRVMLEL